MMPVMHIPRIPILYVRKKGICTDKNSSTPPNKKANPYKYTAARQTDLKCIPGKLILIIHILITPYPANSFIQTGIIGMTVIIHVIPAPKAPPISSLACVAVHFRIFLIRNNSKVSIKKFSRKNTSIYSSYFTTHLPHVPMDTL